MNGYFPKLDSIRFYAFLIVFVSHMYLFGYQAGPYVNQWLDNKGMRLFAHGEVGVQIFFTLSGFLIMLLAIREFRKKHSFSIGGFFRRRILRIWPLYFLALIIGIYSMGVSAEDAACVSKFWYFLGNVCMAQGFSDGGLGGIIGPLWSVSVEEQFYIFFPFVFAGCLFLMRRYAQKIIVYIVGLIAFFVCVWALYSRYIHSGDWNYATVSQLPSLFLGMFLAVVVSTQRYMVHISHMVRKYRISVMGLALISFLAALYIKFAGPLGVSVYVLPLSLATSCMIVLSIVLPDTEGESDPTVSVWSRASQYFGRISYGMYVYHMFAFLLIRHMFEYLHIENTSLAMMVIQVVAVFGLTTGMAHVSYVYIESFFLRFKSAKKTSA